MGFQNGLSGLSASSKNLDVIGHNIANVNTVGAKASRAQFADVYANSLYGSGSANNGIGVQVTSVNHQFTQGDLMSSDNPLDIAINGSGFFQLSTNGALSYSRNGEFRLDKSNFVTTTNGSRLMGYAANAQGNIVTGVPTELRLDMSDIAPRLTSTAGFTANLDARDTAIDAAVPFALTDTESYNDATSITVYDSQGSNHALTTYYRKTGDNAWDVYVAVDGAEISGATPAAPVGSLTFDVNGALLTPAAPINFTYPTAAAVGGTQTIALDLSDLTQHGSAFAITALDQDGFAPGQVAGFSIDSDGVIMASYTNGQTKAQGQIILASFSNPQGLSPLGNNAWGETSSSGQPVVGAPATGVLGSLKSGALEGSNVDLTDELVNMITAQRAYQANAQTIKTQDQIMQTIVNLR